MYTCTCSFKLIGIQYYMHNMSLNSLFLFSCSEIVTKVHADDSMEHDIMDDYEEFSQSKWSWPTHKKEVHLQSR